MSKSTLTFLFLLFCWGDLACPLSAQDDQEVVPPWEWRKGIHLYP